MRIALAQINPELGDFAKNAQKIIDFTMRAKSKHADIVVFSELSLSGYPPNDLLERREIIGSEMTQLKEILKQMPSDIVAVFGAIVPNDHYKKLGKPLQNVAVVARRNKKPHFIAKQLLPSYDIFDETRFFEPGKIKGVINLPRFGRVAITICEDMWSDITDGKFKIYSKSPFDDLKNVDLIINISASPFSQAKRTDRLREARARIKKLKVPMVYVNQVGGQDELIFDGRSFVLDGNGKVIVEAACCEEDLVMIDLKSGLSEYRPGEESKMEVLRKALVLGIRDFVKKTGQRDVHLGLSGGIDSALVAALAVDALGPTHVTGILLPGPYSSPGSIDDSVNLANNLKIKTKKIDTTDIYSRFKKLANDMNPLPSDESGEVSVTEQNIQARIRAVILMAHSNSTGSLLLSTSNKSELASGFSTLYGDSCGGLMPIGDLVKRDIYGLAKHYNSARPIIPEAILKKVPSAELAPGQVDEDTLPPYKELDRAVENIVEKKRAPSNKIEKWLLEKLSKSEFKRWQAPPILRVSEHGFGRGRRFPIAQKAY